MSFRTLRTVSFRNLNDSEISLSGKDIFLVGENGQGKTNFLEAVYFCSYASSFRGVRDSELVRLGEKDCSVSANFSGMLNSSLTVLYKDGKKTITLDSKKTEDRKELLTVAPCIVFCHEDMEFVAGTPERRRWFFDQTLSLWDPLYLDDFRNYRKILKARNNLLKNGEASSGMSSRERSDLLDAFDLQFVSYGLELMKKRQEEIKVFSEIFNTLYNEISGIAGVSIHYLPSWKGSSQETLAAELAGNREKDFSFGLTVSGPHRDRYVFTRAGREFTGKASTGQRRLLALLLRIAQARIFSEKTGKKPVLLLDDVLLELDGTKRKKFLSLMPGYDQAFFTFLPEEPYNLYRNDETMVYSVNDGVLKWEK